MSPRRGKGTRAQNDSRRSTVAPEQDWNRSAAPDRRVNRRLADALIESPRDARIVASRGMPGGPRPIRRENTRRFFDSASPSGAVPSPPAPHRGFVVVALSDILQRPRPDITSLHHASLHLREGRAGSPRRTPHPMGFDLSFCADPQHDADGQRTRTSCGIAGTASPMADRSPSATPGCASSACDRSLLPHPATQGGTIREARVACRIGSTCDGRAGGRARRRGIGTVVMPLRLALDEELSGSAGSSGRVPSRRTPAPRVRSAVLSLQPERVETGAVAGFRITLRAGSRTGWQSGDRRRRS